MRILWLLLVIFLLAVAVTARKHGHKRRRHQIDERQRDDTVGLENTNDEETPADDDDDVDGENDDDDNDVKTYEDEETTNSEHPCYKKKCRRGQVCVIKNWKAACRCQEKCDYDDDPRLQVCSQHNTTFSSECELDRQYCLCKKNLDGCQNLKYKKLHLDYYGICKALSKCEETEMDDFRLRVKDWLYQVMKELKQRKELPVEYSDWYEKAKNEKEHEHAVVWKFCDIDQKPQDQQMSRRELTYTIRSLKGLEHCLVPFLDGCDSNNDRQISQSEWMNCLNLDENYVSEHCTPIGKK